MLPVILVLTVSNLLLSLNAIDTITRTRFISDGKGEFLVSYDGNFRLGLFSPGNSKSLYVGLWFNKVSERTIVCVANREAPLKNSTGILKIADDGNLAVYDGNESTKLWSTNVSRLANNSTTAGLLPSGNLVLTAKSDLRNTGSVICQSFDYPTHAVLPEMKFGWNKRTGIHHVLTSWRSDDDPAPGQFSFGLDPQGSPQFFLYKNSAPYWSGGPWNGRALGGIPVIGTRLKNQEMDYSKESDIFSYSFENNQDEISVSFTARRGTIPSMLTLDL